TSGEDISSNPLMRFIDNLAINVHNTYIRRIIKGIDHLHTPLDLFGGWMKDLIGYLNMTGVNQSLCCKTIAFGCAGFVFDHRKVTNISGNTIYGNDTGSSGGQQTHVASMHKWRGIAAINFIAHSS